jgi:hypothetical protein
MKNQLILVIRLSPQHSLHSDLQCRLTKLKDNVVTGYVETQATKQQDGNNFFQCIDWTAVS